MDSARVGRSRSSGRSPGAAIIELAGAPRRLAVQKTVGPPCVETHPPVSDDLETNAADLRRFCPRRAVVDRSKRQKPPSLRTILRFLRQPPQPRCVEISPKQYRHGEPPSFAMLNQSRADLEISKESRFLELGIRPCNRNECEGGFKFERKHHLTT